MKVLFKLFLEPIDYLEMINLLVLLDITEKPIQWLET